MEPLTEDVRPEGASFSGWFSSDPSGPQDAPTTSDTHIIITAKRAQKRPKSPAHF